MAGRSGMKHKDMMLVGGKVESVEDLRRCSSGQQVEGLGNGPVGLEYVLYGRSGRRTRSDAARRP
jgi:hypothetical protein